MLQKERFDQIYELLKERGSVSVQYLQKNLYASEATIRRDLAEMEKAGLLTRVWGGAMLQTMKKDIPFFARLKSNPDRKKKMASVASALLSDSVSVFLDSSTSCLALVPFLAACRDVTAVTSSTMMARLLSEETEAGIHLLGGQLYESHILTGCRAVESAGHYHTQLMFFSCSGLNSDGIWSVEPRVVEVNREMMKHSEKRVLLCDSSKFGNPQFWRLAEFGEVDLIISDQEPEDMELRELLSGKLITERPKSGGSHHGA
ncbi:MAG: DeoR/GlpR family DNA-binding transcription regulator [Oscillospiraceae bacterium]|nr:DeoR/GlpR family DNA-binding transcription regulator [Oscillospiraceae bacterium]